MASQSLHNGGHGAAWGWSLVTADQINGTSGGLEFLKLSRTGWGSRDCDQVVYCYGYTSAQSTEELLKIVP